MPNMITPEWSPRSSWQLTSILSQPKGPSAACLATSMDLWIWVSDCTTELKPAVWDSEHLFYFHSLPRWSRIFQYWRSQQKWVPTGNNETSAGVFFRLCDTFPRPQIVPSARNEAPETKSVIRTLTWWSLCRTNTLSSTLWPGQHLIFRAFASLQGFEIFLKHCRSNLMLPNTIWCSHVFQAKTVQPIS